MRRIRDILAGAAALALLVPAGLPAQDVPSLLVRVRDGGAPAPGLEVALYRGGQRRLLATTGASGLAVVEFARAPVQPGMRLAVFTVICGDRGEIALTRSANSIPRGGAACERSHLGSIIWSSTERLDVTLGDAPRMAGQTAPSVVDVRSGWRVQGVGSAAFVSGDELGNTETGLGGELLIGFDTADGWGLGAGFAFHRHGLAGVDENLSRYSAVLEPCYTVIRPDWNARPYVATRLTREWLDAEDGAGLSTETGWSFGAGLGVAFPIAGPVSVDLSAHAARLSVSVADFPDSDRGGWLFTLGAGVRF